MKHKLIGLTVAILTVFLSIIPVSANEGLPFDVIPKFTDGQEDGVTNYISIKGNGDSKRETFEFEVKNKSDREHEIVISVVDAYTSPSGLVQYDVKGSENSEIIDDKQKMSNHLTLEQQNKEGNLIVKLEPKETRVIKANLDAKNVEGTLLGGLTFKLFQEGDGFEEDGTTFQINNEISMVIGVIVEFDYNREVDFVIDEPYVDPMPSYYAIRLPVTMESPTFKSAELVYDVLLDDEVQFGANLEYEFTPKSKTNVSLPWELETIKTDKTYRIKGYIGYLENGEEAHEPFDFTFKHKADESIVDKVTSPFMKPLEEGRFPWLLFFTLSIIIIITIITIIKKRKTTYYVLAMLSSDLPNEIRPHDDYYNVIAEVEEIPKGGKETTIGVYKKVLSNKNELYYILDKEKTEESNDGKREP